MMNETKMFCFQCQKTAKGTGCTTRGVCGKLPETSMYMDILWSAKIRIKFVIIAK